MDDIRELERAWYRYKIKRVLRFLSGLFFVGVLSVGAYFAYIKWDTNKNNLLTEKKDLNGSKEVFAPDVVTLEEVNSSTVAIKEPKVITVSNEKHEVSLEPVIPIIDMEKEERTPASTVTKARTTSARNTQSSGGGVRAKPSTYLTASELAPVNNALDSTTQKKINLNATSKNYMETIKEKFSRTKQPREALLLAKAYYAEGNYKDAEHWALVANKLNSNMAESWFIFAKSKAKLGQRDEAITILVSYYKKSHSSEAKVLIEKIKKGTFQ